MADLVAGVDGTKRGWVAVVLAGGRFLEARLIEGVEASFDDLADVGRIAIDVPIGYGPRQADGLARALVGGSSVFAIPAQEKFDAPFAEGGGISAQAHALGDRVRHVTTLAAHDMRFREVHPELCFTAMNDMRRLKYRKKSAEAPSSASGCCAGTGSTSIPERWVPSRPCRSTTCSTRQRAAGRRHARTLSRSPTRRRRGTGSRSPSGTSPLSPAAFRCYSIRSRFTRLWWAQSSRMVVA